MKNIYLLLAVIGALVPYLFFIQFFQQYGLHLPGFVETLFANGAVAGFTLDLLISSVVFWLFMFSENKAGRGPKAYLFILINMTIGLSCALPAYLYARTKPQ